MINEGCSQLKAGLTRDDWKRALVAALLAVAVRVPSCFKGFWIDEYYTLHAARLPLGELIIDRFRLGHFPLYFIYAKLGLLLGNQEWILRLSSLLAMGLTVLLLTGLLGQLGLRRYLRAAWVLAIAFPYWVTIGTELRYMMPMVAASTATAWACVAYAQRQTWARLGLVAATSVLLIALHPVTLFIVMALVGFMSFSQVRPARNKWSPRALAYPMPLVFSMLSVSPLFWVISHVSQLRKPPAPPEMGRGYLDVLEVTLGRSYLWTEWLDYYDLSFNRYIMPAAMTLVLAGGVWAARRELLASGNRIAWRLILALLVVFPVVFLLFSALVFEIQGAARYWCVLSLPALLLLAIGWHATLPPRLGRCWRTLACIVIGMQFVATVLDRGDLQREAAQWIVRHHTPADRVLVARGEAYVDVFKREQFADWDHLLPLDTYRRTPRQVAVALRGRLRENSRLLLMLYRPRTDMENALDRLEKNGDVAHCRVWRLNKVTWIAALARDPLDVAWLHALPDPERPFGTSRGDY